MTERAGRQFVYKVRTDVGAAPCVHRGLLSLAICKPQIRASAEPGDWVFGFGAANLGERLIYVARVSQKLENGAYYRDGRDTAAFEGRPDRIYRFQGNHLKLRRDARHHADKDLRHYDVGNSPPYAKAAVLLSDDFRYFGANATDGYKAAFPAVADLIEALGRGHRVNLGDAVAEELRSLQLSLWAKPRKENPPTDAPKAESRACAPGRECAPPPAAAKSRPACS